MHRIQSLGAQLEPGADSPGLLPCGAASQGIRLLQKLCKGVDDFGFKFFSIYYSCQTNPTASKGIDLFGHSQKYTGKLQLHHIFLQIAISCSVLA